MHGRSYNTGAAFIFYTIRLIDISNNIVTNKLVTNKIITYICA